MNNNTILHIITIAIMMLYMYFLAVELDLIYSEINSFDSILMQINKEDDAAEIIQLIAQINERNNTTQLIQSISDNTARIIQLIAYDITQIIQLITQTSKEIMSLLT